MPTEPVSRSSYWPGKSFAAGMPSGAERQGRDGPAADPARGPSPPIVCSSGRPSVAVVTLLRQLTAAGATAYQHADFDLAGLSITQWLAQRVGTVPWRMAAADYARHADVGPATLPGSVPDTPWDPALRELLGRVRRPVYEEQVRAELLTAMR